MNRLPKPAVRATWTTVGDRHYLTVCGFPVKSLNALLRIGHIFEAPAYKRDILSIVSSPGRPKIKGRAHVGYLRTYRARPCDTDNMVASFKYVQDALVRAGIIEGDEPERLIAEYRQEKKIKDGADWIVVVRAAASPARVTVEANDPRSVPT